MNILVDELDAIVKEKIGNIKINTDFMIDVFPFHKLILIL